MFRAGRTVPGTATNCLDDMKDRDKLLVTFEAGHDGGERLHTLFENRYIRDAVLFTSIQQVFGDLIYCTHETMWHFQDLLCAHLEALGELFGCLLSLVSDHYRKDDGVQL